MCVNLTFTWLLMSFQFHQTHHQSQLPFVLLVGWFFGHVRFWNLEKGNRGILFSLRNIWLGKSNWCWYFWPGLLKALKVKVSSLIETTNSGLAFLSNIGIWFIPCKFLLGIFMFTLWALLLSRLVIFRHQKWMNLKWHQWKHLNVF